jgi:hypothetical protein
MLEMECRRGMRLLRDRCWVCDFSEKNVDRSTLDNGLVGLDIGHEGEGEGEGKDTGRGRNWKRIEVKVVGDTERVLVRGRI